MFYASLFSAILFGTNHAMQLTQHTDFGLRLLIVLARKKGDHVSLPQFAADLGLSYNHVTKVAQALAREGYIRTRRGRMGGVELAVEPDQLSVGAVVRSLERNMQLADCPNCPLYGDCSASPLLAEALAAFMAVLDRTTLTMIAKTRGQIENAQLL
jgi:Rrf2 family transcriptional regulator, nitric oxide-sensitive transcriptional repressor